MYKLTIEVDLDLDHDEDEPSAILGSLMAELAIVRERCEARDPTLKHASGLVLSPLEGDEMVGNWRIDAKR